MEEAAGKHLYLYLPHHHPNGKVQMEISSSCLQNKIYSTKVSQKMFHGEMSCTSQTSLAMHFMSDLRAKIALCSELCIRQVQSNILIIIVTPQRSEQHV